MAPLLPPEQYYRPTRAGELRQQAGRLRRRLDGLRDCREMAALIFGCGYLLPILFLFSAPDIAALLIFIDVLGLGMLAIASGMYEAYLLTPLERWALACEREAEALEREHLARYGETNPLLAAK
jgi:hypothetical protein